jgi:hypothetical protein
MTDDEAAEKRKDRIIEIQSKLFDRAATYANLILIGGYAGAFTIWNSTRAQLSPRMNIVIALLLGISLAVFIFFEVYKMTRNAIHTRRIAEILTTATSSRDFLDKVGAADRRASVESIRATAVWRACLAISVLTAILAIFLLFYNFFALVIGSDPWHQ